MGNMPIFAVESGDGKTRRIFQEIDFHGREGEGNWGPRPMLMRWAKPPPITLALH